MTLLRDSHLVGPRRSRRGDAGGRRPTGPPALALQRAAGNRAVADLLRGDPAGRRTDGVQPGGTVPGTRPPLERELAGAGTGLGTQHLARLTMRPGQVRRTPAEFRIEGKFPDAAAATDTIFFDVAGRVPDAVETAKIPALASPAARALTLKGTASEEGGAGVNTAIVTDRIAAVSALLANAGHTGPRTAEVRPLAGTGDIDYRGARKVEVRASGTPSPTPDCSGGSAPNDCGPAPNPFTTALARAHAMIATARGKLAGPPDKATAELLTRLFGGISAIGTVDANLARIDAQLTNMAPFTPTSGHRCVNACDADCSSGTQAYNSGDGPSAMMTLCPGFTAEPVEDERASVLVHEGSHGTTGLTTNDQAYSWQRLITLLPSGLALANADSYTAFVRLANSPGSITLGPTTPDAHGGGMSAPEQTAADRAVAWVEQWVVGTQSEISSLYATAHESIGAGTWTDPYYRETMGFVAPAFGLTVPPPVPRMSDKVALAGIADRYQKLVDAVGQPLTLTKVATPATTWSAGPGTNVAFGAAFFGLAPADQVTTLLTALIRAQPTIPAARVATYVAVVRAVVTHGSLGSP